MNRALTDSGIEWLGRIPQDWKVLPLKRVLNEKNELNKELKETFLLSLTIQDGVIPYSEKTGGGNKAKEDISKYKIVKENDIVINSMNVVVGAAGISNYNGLVSPVYYVFDGIKGNSTRYYKYLFLNQTFENHLFGLGNGILVKINEDNGKMNTIRKKIPIEKLNNECIPVPQIEEQEKIANYLDNKCKLIDETIENNKKEIELLEEYKSEYLQYKFNSILKDCNIVKLKYLGNFQNGISAGAEKFGHGDGTFINYGDVYNYDVIPNNPNGVVSLTDKEKKIYSLKRGDILFTRTSETIEEVGMSSVCIKDYPDSAFSGFVIRFRPYNAKNMIPEFYKYYFKLKKHRDYFAREMNLVTRASLSQGLLGNIKTIVPSIELQRKTVIELDRTVGSLDKVVEYRKKIIEKLEEYKKSLIYEVVTGKVEVN